MCHGVARGKYQRESWSNAAKPRTLAAQLFVIRGDVYLVVKSIVGKAVGARS